MEEIWRPVVGYEGLYEVSSTGGVDVFAPLVEGDYKYRRILIKRK